MSIRLGMVAGEPSGDLLAARLMRGLTAQSSGILCQGIGGPAMQQQGFEAWHPMNALSVFGYVDAIKRLPSLLRIYSDIKQRWLNDRPDVFVGVDAPDFNLRLELQLRQAGVPTVHFVGPSIWAWRYERIDKIRQAVSHMLVLFPFEEALYQKEGVPVTYVGHPLAQTIPMEPDRAAARDYLGVPKEAKVLALMPGSRASEIRLLAPRFLQAARLLRQQDPDLLLLVPVVNAQRRAEFQALLQENPLPGLRIIDQTDYQADNNQLVSHDGVVSDSFQQFSSRPAAWNVMEAADAVLVASGTATLEAALFKRPMVISYALSPTMRRLMAWKSGQSRPLLPWVGLPNILAREFIVPELLQEQATPQALAEATWQALTDQDQAARAKRHFIDIHRSLLRDTPTLAAQAILDQVNK